MLKDGVCDAPLQQVFAPSPKCTSTKATPNWSPASAASTEAPPMAPLELPVAAIDLEWPSMGRSEKGWDFCNQDSDEDDGWVEEMDLKLALEPESASGPEDDSVAWLVTSGPAQQSEDVVPKRTFAEAVLSCAEGTGAPAVAAGYRMPIPAAITKQEAKQLRSITGSPNDEEAMEGDDFNPRAPGHGWKKQHKASRSGRQQRKLGQQTQKRAEQSFHTRGWLDDGEQDDA